MNDEFLDRAYQDNDSAAVHRLYGEWAESYDDELTTNGYVTPMRVAQALIDAGAPTGGEVIDIGCGTGLSGQALREAGFVTIDGLDYSAEMLSIAEGRGLYRRLGVADLNAPPIDVAEHSYDVVACVGAFGFGHVEPAAVDELVRLARPGGYIAIGVNEPFWDATDLPARIDAQEAAGAVAAVTRSRGEHIAERGVGGWVVTMRAAS